MLTTKPALRTAPHHLHLHRARRMASSCIGAGRPSLRGSSSLRSFATRRLSSTRPTTGPRDDATSLYSTTSASATSTTSTSSASSASSGAAAHGTQVTPATAMPASGRLWSVSPSGRRHVSSSLVSESAIKPSAPSLRSSMAAPALLVPSPMGSEGEMKRKLEAGTAKLVPRQLLAEWREMFKERFFKEDMMAALSVTMVSIPMNLAIAIGSGVPPEIGVLTGVVAGATAALLGGSKMSITGPTASMSMLVANAVRDHGMAGMALATIFCGAIQMATGAMKVGGIVKLTPMPVMAGFMAGIGAMIMNSQLPAALGIKKLNLDTIWLNAQHLFSSGVETISSDQVANLISMPSLALAASTLGLSIAIGKTKLASKVPPVMAAVAITAIAQTIFQFPGVEMIQPLPSLMDSMRLFSMPGMDEIAHIGGLSVLFFGVCSMESLLSCSMVDKLAKARRGYDPNQELLGQGVSNMACGLIGGIPATSVIARSSLSVLAGAKTRRAALSMSGMLLLSTALLSDVFHHIPVPTLAGVLLVLSAKMMNNGELKHIWAMRKSEALIPGGITIAGMLGSGLVSGVAMGLASSLALNLYHRKSLPRPSLSFDINNAEIADSGKKLLKVSLNGQVDFLAGMNVQKMQTELDQLLSTADSVMVQEGSEKSSEGEIISPRLIKVDMSNASITDTSGAIMMAELITGLQRAGHTVNVIHALPECKDLLLQSRVPADAILLR